MVRSLWKRHTVDGNEHEIYTSYTEFVEMFGVKLMIYKHIPEYNNKQRNQENTYRDAWRTRIHVTEASQN